MLFDFGQRLSVRSTRPTAVGSGSELGDLAEYVMQFWGGEKLGFHAEFHADDLSNLLGFLDLACFERLLLQPVVKC